jgi:hypothetical protein
MSNDKYDVMVELVQEDEPLFVLRGKDKFALEALSWYYGACYLGGASLDFLASVRGQVARFETWAIEHEGLMKVPD